MRMIARNVVWIVLVWAVPVSAQQDAQLQIVNAGTNLGWITGILETEPIGARPTNITEVTTGLTNTSAALTALQPLIASPPYDTRPYARVVQRIARIVPRVAGMDRRVLLREIRGLRAALISALQVVLDARTNRLRATHSHTCDSAIFDVGFNFGVGHTAIQRGNMRLEQRSRGRLRRTIASGQRASRRLACPFAGAYSGLAMLATPTRETYAQALPQMQSATLAGGATPTVAPPPPPTPAPVTAPVPAVPVAAPAAAGVPTAPTNAARPDLSARCQWSSSYGVVHFEQGYYSIPNKTLQGQLGVENGRWVFRGRWGRQNNPNHWGQVVFTFDSATSFTGYYTRRDSTAPARRWNGRAQCAR